MVTEAVKAQYQIKEISGEYCDSEEDPNIELPKATAKRYKHTSTKHRVENHEELHESRHHKNKYNQHHRYKSKKRTIRDREVEDVRLDKHQGESEEYKKSKWSQEAKFQRKKLAEKMSNDLMVEEPTRDEGVYDEDTRNDNKILDRHQYHLKSSSSIEKHRRSHERRSNQDRNEKNGNKVWEEPKLTETLKRQQTTISFKDPSPDLSVNDSLMTEIHSNDKLKTVNPNVESSTYNNDLNNTRSANRLNDDSYDYTNYINSSAVSDEETSLPEKPDENSVNYEEVDFDSLPPYLPAIQGCRNVDEYERLNRVAEGTYGIVYRAVDKRTKEVVAIKRLKMENETEGFPTTSLREINTLLKAQHLNIVKVREIVVGNNMNKIFIVMDYIEHDLKALMDLMELKNQVFLMSEIKCLMKQLLKAVAHLHRNWILHRDLKPSNLLLSNKGILKVGDFGLAREYGSPIKQYTSTVVTPWYRAPELLLGSKLYSTPIDVWSVGCIFAELLTMEPLFPGRSEIDLLHRIFKKLGTPNDKIWPGYSELPVVKSISFAYYPVNNLRQQFSAALSESGLDLLLELLTYNPDKRIEAKNAFKHNFFQELPLPIEPDMFPTWPAKSEFGVKASEQMDNEKFKQLDEKSGVDLRHASRQIGGGFCLKF